MPDRRRRLKRMLVLDTEQISAHNEINKTSVRLGGGFAEQSADREPLVRTVILLGLAKSGRLA
jgi:hypothetical protein